MTEFLELKNSHWEGFVFDIKGAPITGLKSYNYEPMTIKMGSSIEMKPIGMMPYIKADRKFLRTYKRVFGIYHSRITPNWYLRQMLSRK